MSDDKDGSTKINQTEAQRELNGNIKQTKTIKQSIWHIQYFQMV